MRTACCIGLLLLLALCGCAFGDLVLFKIEKHPKPDPMVFPMPFEPQLKLDPNDLDYQAC